MLIDNSDSNKIYFEMIQPLFVAIDTLLLIFFLLALHLISLSALLYCGNKLLFQPIRFAP